MVGLEALQPLPPFTHPYLNPRPFKARVLTLFLVGNGAHLAFGWVGCQERRVESGISGSEGPEFYV